MNKKDLGQKSKKNLVKLARDMQISGRSKLSKAELVDAVFMALEEDKHSGDQLDVCLDVQEEVEDSKYYTGSDDECDFYIDAVFSDKYEDDSVVIMVVSPGMIYAYWELSTKTLKVIRQRRKKNARVMLRVYYIPTSTKQEVFFDIPTEEADNWYINTPESGCSYWVEIGTTSTKGVFKPIMTSNTLDVPRSDFSDCAREIWTSEESVDCFEDEDFEDNIQEVIEVENVKPTSLEIESSIVTNSDSHIHVEASTELAKPTTEQAIFIQPEEVSKTGHEILSAEEVSETGHELLSAEEVSKTWHELLNTVRDEAEPNNKLPADEEKHDVEPDFVPSVQETEQLEFANKVYALSRGVRFDYEGKTFIVSGESAEIARGLSSAELASMSGSEVLAGIGSAELSSWVFSNISGVETEKSGKNLENRDEGAAKRKFWYVLDAELIVYGATESDAHVTLRGEPIKLRRDGTFTVRFPLPDGVIDIPVLFESNDKVDSGVIETKVTRETEYR